MIASIESNLSPYRQKLKEIWKTLVVRNISPQSFTVSWYKGVKLILYQDSEISRDVFIEGIYKPDLFHCLNKFLRKGMVVIDIGANTGLVTLLLLSRLVMAAQS